MGATCIVSFSSRKNGNCAQIAGLAAAHCGQPLIYDFAEFSIHPCGPCDYDCFRDRESCPYVRDKERELLDAVTHSAQALFILPNYCDYPCANFFIFNERSQCYFQRRPDLLDAYEKVPKKAIVVSNTQQENFRTALAYHAEAGMNTLFLSPKQYGSVSIRGDLLSSQQAVRDILAFLKQPSHD